MKRALYILMALCLMFISCSEELGQVRDNDENCIVLNLYNTSLTKAVDVQGEEYERTLKRLDCFFYSKGETGQPCIYYHKVENLDKVGTAQIPIYIDESLIISMFGAESTCEVFVIANLSTEIIGDKTFASDQKGTDVETLGQSLLTRSNENYDAIDQPFVMAGLAECRKDSQNNAQATVELVRAAAKVTFSVIIPHSITVTEKTLVDGEVEESVEREMKPVITTSESMTASFHNGASKGYVYGTYPVEDADIFVTEKFRFQYDSTIPEVPASDTNPVAIPAKDVYVLEMPLYTYARAWEKGDPKAAYWSFQMQWGYDSTGDKIIDKYHPYYYQILINGAYRSFEPNHWYDMTVNVGVLGSTIEATPAILEELSYYVLNWTTETPNDGSGDRLEDVELQRYNYLEVPQTYIEMDNVSKVGIRYNASHKIGVKFDRTGSKSVPSIDGEVNYPAFYISNYNARATSNKGQPRAVEITDIVMKSETVADTKETSVDSNFKDNNLGLLTFEYTLDTEVVCSPAYIFITIWLDTNGDGIHDDDEVLTQDVTIVMYPAIYIIGDRSTDFSVFINGNYNTDRSTDGNGLDYITIANQRVGKAVGYDASKYMHIISVSSFSEDNCEFNIGDDAYRYIVGDPRSRSTNKFGVQDDDATVKQDADGWIKAKDINGVERNLKNYYPTSIEAGAFQVISPKFRISSKLAGYSHCSTTGAAYRCAAYQEDGFPAGRWRLPTTAEVLFVINLQEDDKIEELFVGSSNYASATHTINNNGSVSIREGLHTDSKGTISVRCVYDEWYWGSEKEAIENDDYSLYGRYEFTWGDEKIW